MQSVSIENPPRKFLHSCHSCGRKYRLVIRVDLHVIHKAACPHCNHEHFFDNRDGKLDPGSYSPASDEDQLNGAGFPSSAGREESPLDREETGEEGPGDSGGGSVSLPDMFPNTGRFSNRGQPSPTPREERNWTRLARRVRGELPRLSLDFSGISGFFGTLLGVLMIPPRFLKTALSWALERSSELLGELSGNRLKTALALAILTAFLPVLLLFLCRFFPGAVLLKNPDHYLFRLKAVRANQVLDRDGELLTELFSRKTGSLETKRIPNSLKQKLIFVEDQSFYNHGGIHWPSVARAFFINIFSGGFRQGGSTLTQQLARILLADRSRNLLRKLRETALAYHLESKLSKEEILTAYMNHVYLGHGASGMDVAARFYFDKDIEELNFTEELILVSLPSAPERYSPLRNPVLLQTKLNALLVRMQKEKFPAPAFESFPASFTNVLRNLNKSPGASIFGARINRAPYVAEYVRLQIRKILGKEFEYNSGLRIVTTIDSRLQEAAARETKIHLRKLSRRLRPVKMKEGRIIQEKDLEGKIADFYARASLGPFLMGLPADVHGRPRLQAAAVGIDPRTGEVLFMQGGARFKSGNQLNRAVDMRRQTGSSIKPVVYSAAIESGTLTPASPLDDRPIYARRKIRRPGRPDYWLPGNYSGVYEGRVSVRRALTLSKNVPAILTARKVGLPRLSEQFRKMFFTDQKEFEKRFRYDETIAIGSLEMSPLEMAVAFGAFADNGTVRRPYLIKTIADSDGKVLYNGTGKDEFDFKTPAERKVFSGDVAHVMYTMLRESGRRGGILRGGLRANSYMGKTGTTNNFRDAWFVGAVPGVSAAVWVGYDDPSYSMYRGTGTSAAGPLWGRILRRYRGKERGFHFSPMAVQVQVCEDSGLLPLPSCPFRIKEYFVRKHVPGDTCELHAKSATYRPGSDVNVHKKSDFD